ncbi:uncharacterized protein LACBIDRAFT_330974 [Laccaria bicolor S238N-H82]|uniref:Predicted protein n=1 Tax=Laccaria bicolor (strain S238N-H82 / ATCC MYA-4686) TaxID=486041 RepID=B0DMV2_LACBS|nr:uncharacterized protein LACBIDRAFT_330974 [Laccaria bicolor S238N-H82]EDR04036.1 predicted protein [Laccaria bicolor S238N-H82]|eukprot:XP_001885291.1 predicted protein [Laccaria bicolor S238N-H82]
MSNIGFTHSMYHTIETEPPALDAEGFAICGSCVSSSNPHMQTRCARHTGHVPDYVNIAKWMDDKSSIDTAKPEDCNHQLILRNLTKKQYVRDDPTSTTLGTVLLARICWSSDPSRSMAYEGHDLTRGVWAGDRFDITTLDRLEEDESTSGLWTTLARKFTTRWHVSWKASLAQNGGASIVAISVVK